MSGAVETVRLSDLGRWAQRYAADLARIDWTPALKVVKVLVAAEHKRYFATGTSPLGQKWLPLKRPSKRRGGRSAKPLRDRGILMASVTAQAAGHVEEITRTRLVYGTNLGYAGFHQYGTRRIPKREHVGFSVGLLRRVDKVLADHAAKYAANKR